MLNNNVFFYVSLQKKRSVVEGETVDNVVMNHHGNVSIKHWKQSHSLPTCLCNRMHSDTNSSLWINHYQN